ncbi:MAG: anaerobic ribonucleoside triphosphate reductase [Clostridia bacterium]|nr:anaerobic ribonucleoside triphosphate reductase [Clostridia bacterium]
MVTKIIKRDGRTVPFNVEKIAQAIYKAAVSVGGNNYKEAEDLAAKVCERLERDTSTTCPTVEQVQDVVERTLIDEDCAATAKAYILYRAERTKQREMNSEIMKTYEKLTFEDAKDNDVKRENANVNADTAMGTMLKYGSEGAKKFYQMFVLKKEHADAHASGDIHIHDLDFLTLTTTCCQIDLIKLFKDGFSTGEGHLREPQSIGSYAALAAIAIQSNQNDQHGGQSIPNFEYAMAIGVRKSYKKLYLKNLQKALELLTDVENSEDTSKKVINKINEEQMLVPALERAIDVLKDAKYSKEIAKSIISKLREQTDIIPSLQKTIELLAELESSEDISKAIMSKVYNEHGVIPSLEDTTGYLAYEKEILIEKYGEVLAEKIQKFCVKYTDKEITRDTFQAMEGFIHNLNTMHSRAGAQVPFSSINYGLDTTPEGRLVMEQLLYATDAGLGKGETPIFPIQILKIKDGINYNEGEPNYDIFKLGCRVSAKRLFPNFSFIDAPFNIQYYKPGDYNSEIAYMGCRTRVMANNYDPTREVTCGRGNLSFTSINLPRLGILAKGDVDKFFEMLSERIDLVVDQLLDRLNIQSHKKVMNYPFLMGQGVWLDSEKLNPNDEVGEILKHGTLTLGFIGLAECLKALIGKHHGESEEAQKLGLRIVGYMRDRMDQTSEKTNLNFSLIATPAEGLSGRFVKIDKKKFGIIEGVTDRDYYTNSFHVPVYYKISAFDKITREAPYHNLTNGGHISYVELDGDPTKNLDAFEQVVRCMKESGIGYGAINHPVDRDPICGYTGIIESKCPHCGRTDDDETNVGFERIRRITGYLVGTVDRFNNAKRAEEHDRVKHNVGYGIQ